MSVELLRNSEMKIDNKNVQLEIIKNFIKKDLDVFNWINGAYRGFGDIQIYSDHKLDLNCFDQAMSLLIGREIQYGEESLETIATSKCVDYLFESKMFKNNERISTEEFSIKFTKYISDASCILLDANLGHKEKILDELFKKYFPDFAPIVWNCLSSTYLDQKM